MLPTKPFVGVVLGIGVLVGILVSAFAVASFFAIELPGLLELSAGEKWNLLIGSTITTFVLFLAFWFQRSLVIWELEWKLDSRRGLQRHVDQLASFRKKVINDVYAKTPTQATFATWKADYEKWQRTLEDYLKASFPFAVFELFADLGIIQSYDFSQASPDTAIRDAHIHCLRMLAKQLGIIEGLIQEHTAVVKDSEPGFTELMRWLQHEHGRH